MNLRWLPGKSGSVALLATSASLLIWGSVLGGFRYGPVRAVLRAVPYSDKLGHFALYGGITLALAFLVRTRRQAIGAGVGVIALGIGDEIRQRFEGGRNFDIIDVLANLGGVSLGLLAALLLMRVAKARGLSPLAGARAEGADSTQ